MAKCDDVTDRSSSHQSGSFSYEEEEDDEELETPFIHNKKKYEKQRLKRIQENRARMEALGISKIASSLMMGSTTTTNLKKNKPENKKQSRADDEYVPVVGDEDSENEQQWDDDADCSGSHITKGKKKSTTYKKKVPVQKRKINSGIFYEDEALKQAIALSLQDSWSCLNTGCGSQSPEAPADGRSSGRKGIPQVQEDTGKRKRKKPVTSRVQMSEDEVVVHFCQFDETGKGAISLRDMEKMANIHDFTWTEKELADMIYCFDSDGDGKLSLDDFRKIVGQCNMIQSSGCS